MTRRERLVWAVVVAVAAAGWIVCAICASAPSVIRAEHD